MTGPNDRSERRIAVAVAVVAALAMACVGDGGAGSDRSATTTAGSSSPSSETTVPEITDGGLPDADPYRPAVHFTPRRNWMNDPNGPIYLNGRYHLFYQYNPTGPLWGEISWGHAVSEDLIRWEELPVAIPADPPNMVFSGSAVVDRAATSGLCDTIDDRADCVVAVYTGHRVDPATTLTRQDQRLAVSLDDGTTFTPYVDNPVIDYALVDFRDPNVFRHDETESWIMVIALPLDRQVAIFRSTDLVNWEEVSRFGPTGAVDGVWECPVLFELPVLDGDGAHRWVMKVDHNPGHVTGGSGAQYFVGEFDGRTFVPDEWQAPPRWVDWGPDFYCAMPFSDEPITDDGRTWIAWMSNWEYAADTPTDPWRGAMTLPRRVALELRDGRPTLVQTPIETLAGVTGEPIELVASDAGTLDEQLRRIALPDVYRLRLDVELGGARNALLVLGLGEESELTISYDRVEGTLVVDRSASGESLGPVFGRTHVAPLGADRDRLVLDILVDRSSVEIFADDGAVVFTELVFPADGPNTMALDLEPPSSGTASIEILPIG